MKRALLLVALLALLVPAVPAGEWRGAGSPLALVADGAVHGTVVTAGGHGYTSEQPYVEYVDLPPGEVRYGRLSVPVWNYNEGDTLDVAVNGQALQPRTDPDVASAWGVASYLFDAHELLRPGRNVIEVRYRNQNGAPYAIYLTAVVENASEPLRRFFLFEGNTALASSTHLDRLEVPVNGSIETAGLANASLRTMEIAGTAGERDRLLFNDRLLGEDVGRAKSGPYLDIDAFDLTGAVKEHGNRIVFERGDEAYLHPFTAALVLQYADGGAVPTTGIAVHAAEHSADRAVPLPVIAVLVLSALGGGYLFWSRRRRR
jgi:hypothetical protein